MANLQVRDIDDALYDSLKKLAQREKRSVSQEVVNILQKYLSLPEAFNINPTAEFLSLAGSWDDNKTADQIIDEIRQSRNNSSRFGDNDELFD